MLRYTSNPEMGSLQIQVLSEKKVLRRDRHKQTDRHTEKDRLADKQIEKGECIERVGKGSDF